MMIPAGRGSSSRNLFDRLGERFRRFHAMTRSFTMRADVGVGNQDPAVGIGLLLAGQGVVAQQNAGPGGQRAGQE